MRSAQRTCLSALVALAACRGETPDIVVPIADGLAVSPLAAPETYAARAKELGMGVLLVPWTEPDTDVARIAAAARAQGLSLVVGLTSARPVEDEWNRPGRAPEDLDAAIDRALRAGDTLAGLHLDHAAPGLPRDDDAAYLADVAARVRAKTSAKLGVALRARTVSLEEIQEAGVPAPPKGTDVESLAGAEAIISWAVAWARAIGTSADRVVVLTPGDARPLEKIAQEVTTLRKNLPSQIELWAVVETTRAESTGALGSTPPRLRPARDRAVLQQEIGLLRGSASKVLAGGAEGFAPSVLLAPDAPARQSPAFDPDRPLEARALDAERRMRRCCLRDGQVVSVYDGRDENDAPANLWQEDACWMTGLYAAAASFRRAATGDREAEENARAAFLALHRMANVTPLRGEVVRSFVRTLPEQTRPVAPGSDTRKRWWRAPDEEVFWVGDVSVDQLSGWFFGMAAYHDLVATASERRTIAEDVASVIDVILAHDLKAIEHTGQPTTYGDLRGQPVLALAFLQIAHHVTGDEKYRREYERLLDDEGMAFGVANVLGLYHAARRFGSDHFYASAFWPLIQYERDPARRRQLELGAQVFEAEERTFGNAYGDIVLASLHPMRDTARRAQSQIRAFDPRLLENAAWLGRVKDAHPGPFVPVGVRPAAELDFDYVPPGPKALRGGLEHRFTGIGFVLSYWIGRYHGLL